MEQLRRVFTRQDLFLTDDSPATTYDTERQPLGVHHGHWKLTLADLMLFVFWWNPVKVQNPLMVVAGGSPGNHFAVILRLFPKLKIHVYDPNPFFTEKPGNDHYADEFAGRIFVYHEYFTDEIAKLWSERPGVFFTSDIRSVSHEETTPEKYYEAIIADNRSQEFWVKEINPVAAMIKFKVPILRLPDGREDEENTAYKGLDGFVVRGVWSRLRTTECRLVPIKGEDGKYAERVWDALQFRDQNMFNNYYHRVPEAYVNPYTGDETNIRDGELVNDYDSLATAYILDEYLRKVGIEKPSVSQVLFLFSDIDKMLREVGRTNLTIADLRTTGWRSTGKPSDDDIQDFKRWGVDVPADNDFIGGKRIRPPRIERDENKPKRLGKREEIEPPSLPGRGRGKVTRGRGRKVVSKKTNE